MLALSSKHAQNRQTDRNSRTTEVGAKVMPNAGVGFTFLAEESSSEVGNKQNQSCELNATIRLNHANAAEQ